MMIKAGPLKRQVARLVELFRTRETAVLAALFAVVTGTWAFIAIAGEVVEGDTQAIDERLLRAMQDADGNPVGPPWLDHMARDVTALGGYAVLLMVSLAVVGFLRLDRKFHAMWFVVGAVLSGYFMTMSLKFLFARPRPAIITHLVDVERFSFPSGHSMMSAVVYLTLGTLLTTLVADRRLKLYFLTVAIVLTGLIGLTRLYLGVHYPTDVLAGWAAGLAWSMLCWLIARALQRQGTIEEG